MLDNNKRAPIVISAFMHTGKALCTEFWSDAVIYISGEGMTKEEFVAEVQNHLKEALYEYILVPANDDARKALKEADIGYLIVAPITFCKDDYIRKALLEPDRSIERIEWLNDNWNYLIERIKMDDAPKIWLDRGEILPHVLFGMRPRT